MYHFLAGAGSAIHGCKPFFQAARGTLLCETPPEKQAAGSKARPHVPLLDIKAVNYHHRI
jgi:hypothetical protein